MGKGIGKGSMNNQWLKAHTESSGYPKRLKLRNGYCTWAPYILNGRAVFCMSNLPALLTDSLPECSNQFQSDLPSSTQFQDVPGCSMVMCWITWLSCDCHVTWSCDCHVMHDLGVMWLIMWPRIGDSWHYVGVLNVAHTLLTPMQPPNVWRVYHIIQIGHSREAVWIPFNRLQMKVSSNVRNTAKLALEDSSSLLLWIFIFIFTDW